MGNCARYCPNSLNPTGSIAGLMLTTEAIIADLPEKKSAPVAPAHHDDY